MDSNWFCIITNVWSKYRHDFLYYYELYIYNTYCTMYPLLIYDKRDTMKRTLIIRHTKHFMTRFRIFEQKIRILTKKSGHRQNLNFLNKILTFFKLNTIKFIIYEYFSILYNLSKYILSLLCSKIKIILKIKIQDKFD